MMIRRRIDAIQGPVAEIIRPAHPLCYAPSVPRGSRPPCAGPTRDPTYVPPRGIVDGGDASTPEVCRLSSPRPPHL